MDNERKNFYEVLEIEANATPNQIENAYIRSRKLIRVKVWHSTHS